ncbi:MAG: flavodoxin family protein [Alphaproteobacteria bacterium]|nr:flavodoxin family protein [Alphaproteobacteria bacterium]MDE2162142.1 flavodoxin family protein [Alphaproteobacteria bacterium]MDE2266934.1 flavodoxin family protein [Alphaproteobacteria bacterium]
MTRVAIVYHSGYGHTHEQAKAVAAGAASVPGIEPELLRIENAGQDFAPVLAKLEKADAIIFGSPTYMGSASAPFKAFMEASSKPWFEQKWRNKMAAGFTNSGSQSGDKESTLMQFVTLAAQHGMVWVSLGLPPGNNSTKGSVEDFNRLGISIGAGAQSPVDAGPDVGPSASDKKTAEHLGRRVAEAAKQWNSALIDA